MKLERIEVPTHKELFIRKMQDMILAGELEPGSRIPPERELAEGMGVSRTVINSGIATLVDQGFLKVQPRQGTFVADYKKEGTLKTLRAILELKGDILTDAEIRSILEIRWALGQLTLRHAIENASDEQVAELGKCLEKLKKTKTPIEASEACFEFQWTLSAIGGSDMLTTLISSFKPAVITLWQRFCRRYGVDVLSAHTEITYQYVQKRDLEGALQWLTEFTKDAMDGDYTVYNS